MFLFKAELPILVCVQLFDLFQLMKTDEMCMLRGCPKVPLEVLDMPLEEDWHTKNENM